MTFRLVSRVQVLRSVVCWGCGVNGIGMRFRVSVLILNPKP